MLTNVNPFLADDKSVIIKNIKKQEPILVSEVNSNVFPDIDIVLSVAMSKSVKDRYTSIDLFLKEFRDVLKKNN